MIDRGDGHPPPPLAPVRLEIRHLELLLAVERAGSVSGAARSLGVDQPHVTRRLRQIEELVGHRIFDRSGTGTRVTVAGAGILDRARTAKLAVDRVAPVGDPAPGSDGVRVRYRGLDPVPVVVALRERFPGVALDLAVAGPAEGRAALLAGTADLLLTRRGPHEPWPDPAPLGELGIVTDPTVVLLPARHPLAGRDGIDLAELADDDWITGEAPEAVRTTREECRLLGGFEPRTRYRSDEPAVVEDLLERGLGVALGAESAPRRAGHVARRYRGATPAHWTLSHRPGAIPVPVLAELAEAVRTHHATLLARAAAFERRRG